MVKYVKILFFTAILVLIRGIVFSQYHLERKIASLDILFEKQYGLDQLLINGIQYYNLYPKAPGHAFFNEGEFKPGSVTIENKVYDNLYIKYDIYNHRLVLYYNNSFGGIGQIVLHNQVIDEFEMDDKIFKKYKFPEFGDRFYEVIADGKILCLYYWEKRIVKNQGDVESYYKYTGQKKKTFLVISGTLYPYSGKRSFLKLFPKNQHSLIKQYIADNGINLKSASNQEIGEFIQYCGQLIGP